MRTKDANSSANDHKDDAADEGIGSRAEIRIWQKRYKRDGAQETVAVESLGGSQRFDTHFAVVVEQVFTERNALDLTRLTINSPHILRALREVVGSYPTVPADFNEPFEMESPFQMLFHYWEDLDVYRQRAEDDDARMHLNILLDFMETDMGLEKKRCDTQVKKEQVDYLRLWTIYRPGDLQIAYEKGHAWLLRCVKTAYEESQSAGKWMEVHCTYTDYDGTHVGEAQHIFKIYQKKAFASENPANIKDLPVYPRHFVVGQEGLEERLNERGKRSLTLRGIHVCAYEGLAAYIKEPPLDWWHWNMLEFETIWWPYTESGRVVIDRKTFQEDNQLAQVAIRPDTVDPELMLYPPFVYGYSLSRKEWCRFYVPQISDVEWNSNSFDKLILQESQKTLLRALVSSHAFPPNPRDQTQQKGKGLVVLLHGSPGSGKTLTAECSAELTHKALLSTSMAELNKENRAWYFEYRLAQVLQYATIWQAVVLLDEADVFLEARKDDSSDASERNALVAVFLKHLEYFSGIVFLTTNRIHVFDAAMKSRVHLALGYKPPEREMRRAIWRQTLLSLPAENIKMDVDDAIESLIDENLNGREITNAIHTARTLARYEESPLMLKHIEIVFGVKNDFDVSLKRMRDFALASGSSRGGSLVKPLVRQGSLLGALSDEPEELGQ